MQNLERKIHKDRDEILHFIGKHDRVYIYGKGYVGNYIKKYLDEEDICPAGFVVTDDKGDENCCEGIPVFLVREMNFSEKDGIIIAVSEKNQKEIATLLVDLGVGKEHIYGQKMICTHDGALENLSGKLKEHGSDNGDYFSIYTELDSIGKKAGTDKSSQWHNYLSKYEFFIARYKNEKINVLELGVLEGDSVRMWQNYFSKAEVYGVDINPESKRNEDERIKVIIGNLDDISFIQSLSDINPSIIIDDASHSWNQQILALCTLYHTLPSGGIYILEDIETSFSAQKHRGYDNAVISGYELCEAISKVVTSGEFLNLREESAAVMNFKDEIYDIASKTAMISYIYGSCIFIRN